MILVDEGREGPNITMSGLSSAGVPMMAQHRISGLVVLWFFMGACIDTVINEMAEK